MLLALITSALAGPPPPGCDTGPVEPGESTYLDVRHRGIDRRVRVFLPSDYDCTPRPLLVGLHGYYGSGSGFQDDTSELTPFLEEHGVIGVFPDGLPMGDGFFERFVTSFNDRASHQDTGPDGLTCVPDSYDYGVYDNCPPREADRLCFWGTSCADDQGFLRTLVGAAQTRLSVDPEKVWLTGFSQGGQTTQSLGSQLADVFTAIAPSHGFAANGWTRPPETRQDLFQMWGRSDRIVDGNDLPSSDGMIYDGADETLLEWAVAQGCDLEPSPYPTVSDGTRGWACTTHADCATGARLVSCAWDGGHVWPRSGGDAFGNEALFAFLLGD